RGSRRSRSSLRQRGNGSAIFPSMASLHGLAREVPSCGDRRTGDLAARETAAREVLEPERQERRRGQEVSLDRSALGAEVARDHVRTDAKPDAERRSAEARREVTEAELAPRELLHQVRSGERAVFHALRDALARE